MENLIKIIEQCKQDGERFQKENPYLRGYAFSPADNIAVSELKELSAYLNCDYQYHQELGKYGLHYYGNNLHIHIYSVKVAVKITFVEEVTN